MSNFIYGRIICNDVSCISDSKIDISMVQFSVSNDFAIHFIETLPMKNTIQDINFQFADNYLIHYCEFFMEPIIYTSKGNPNLKPIEKDLGKLKALMQIIFSFDFVDMVELRFSYVEVDEDEYEVFETDIATMKSIIIDRYLSNTQIPVMKLIIRKNSKVIQ